MASGTPFHLSPAMAITGVIDYGTTEGRKHFERSIAPLSVELFDCESDDLHLFIDALITRAREMGWDIPGVGINDILLDPTDPHSEYKNILRHHGELTLDQIRAFEATYIATGTRAAQDTYSMYRCIMNSVKKNTLKRISVWNPDFHVNTYASGNSLFKVICRESGLDTKTTTSYIRKSLTSLDQYMSAVGDDILKFNTYVRGLVRSLGERGEQTYDLITHLTNGYMSCKDKAFRKYIADIIERDEDDPTTILTPDILMVRAANKYKSRVQNKTWKQPDDVEKELMALRAEVHKNNRKSPFQHKHSKTDDAKSPAQTKDQKKTFRINPDTWKNRPKWLKDHVRPDNLTSSRHFGGCQFWFCCDENGGGCNHWAKHRPEQCYRKKSNAKRKANKTQSSGTAASTSSTTSSVGATTQDNDRTKRVRIAEAILIPSPDDPDIE